MHVLFHHYGLIVTLEVVIFSVFPHNCTFCRQNSLISTQMSPSPLPVMPSPSHGLDGRTLRVVIKPVSLNFDSVTKLKMSFSVLVLIVVLHVLTVCQLLISTEKYWNILLFLRLYCSIFSFSVFFKMKDIKCSTVSSDNAMMRVELNY